MPSDNKPNSSKPSGKTAYDNELSALPSLHADPTKKQGNAEKNEADDLAKLQQGIADIGDKLGKGFTGAMAKGVAARQLGGKRGLALLPILVKGNVDKKKRTGMLIGGGVGAIIIGIIVFLLSSLPFGFKSVMTNIVNKEMKVVRENMDDLQERFASHYIVKYLLPGMKAKGCESTIIDKSCAVTVDGDGPLDRMFRSWQKNNIEKRWAQYGGFEIKYDKKANRYFMRATGVEDIEITDMADKTNVNIFREVKKKEIRAEIRTAMRIANKNATFHDRILMRWGLGKMMKDQYNIRRCVLACKVLDAREKYFEEVPAVKKQAFKIMLAKRVLMPRSEILGLAYTCLFAGSECDPNEPDIDPETGEYRTKFESDIQVKMAELLAQDGGDVTLKKAQEMTAALREKGMSQYVVERIVGSILSKTGASDAVEQTTTKIAGQAVPVLGTVVAVSSAISLMSTIGTTAKSLNTQMNEQSAMQLYGMNSTYADEIGSANVDADMVGSFSEAFAENQEKLDSGEMGGAGAGAVPLYNAVINNGDQTQTAFNGIFGARVYAAGDADNHTTVYKCPISGDTLDPSGRDGKLICPEQSLKYASFITGAFGSVSNFLNSPGISVITSAADWITSVVGAIGSTLSGPLLSTLEKAPGYSSIVGAFTSGVTPIFEALSKFLFPNWINDNMSGATNFVGTDLGARVASNKYAEDVLRGEQLTPEQVHAIETQADAFDEMEFNKKSFYARMFDQDEPHSFVTRLSLALPTNFRSSGGQIFSELISDPFTKIVRGFGAIFSGQTAFAASPKILPDPFGVIHYGRSTEDTIFEEDPQAYYASRCQGTEHNEEWNKHLTVDPDLGTAHHTQKDNCAFLNEGARMGGAIFDSSFVDR